jgi:hypothetical protein
MLIFYVQHALYRFIEDLNEFHISMKYIDEFYVAILKITSKEYMQIFLFLSNF